jgi:hypothetical protein
VNQEIERLRSAPGHAPAKIIAYHDVPRWTSIKAPALIGYHDGERYETRLDRHWFDVGMSRSGMSSLINAKFAHVTLADDAVLWVCGADHLLNLVWPWIRLYMDTGKRLPIDWIAAGRRDTLRMLMAGMRVARWRQSAPLGQRAAFKNIIIHLNQASFVLVVKTVCERHGDGTLNPSEAAAMLLRGAGSAGVHLHLSSPRGMNDRLGDHGPEINSNIATRTVFRTQDQSEVGRAMGDFQLWAPEHRGEFWFRQNSVDPARLLNAPYLQQDDRLATTKVSDVAWARQDFLTTLDAGSAQAAGEHYPQRFTTAGDELYRYLLDADRDGNF